MTNAPEEPTEPTQAEEFARNALAGHPQGAVRRIILYVLAFGLVISPVAVLAVIPLALLAMSDNYV